MDDFGLPHALRIFISQLGQDAGSDIDCQVDPDWPKLPPDLETTLFRIIQEAMTNAHKHARADRVQIALRADDGQLSVEVRDWGGGFDVKRAPQSPESGLHIGLIGIRERARVWGGKCCITSKVGEGTRITVTIPWSPAQTQRGSID